MRYIYLIRNVVNDKSYIGQSKVPQKRWVRHKYDAITRLIDSPLYRSIRKHGVNNFTFSIIDQSEEDDLIDHLEIFWIQKLKSNNLNYGYNLESGGCNNKIVSQETKNKQSISAKKRYTLETQNKLRESKKTEQSRKNSSKSSLGSNNGRAIVNEMIVKEIRRLWETNDYKQIELSEKFNLSTSTINHIVKRYTWKHI
jgi:group I intron endonuclease